MKKLIYIFSFFLISSNVFANKIFTISCEGEIVTDYYEIVEKIRSEKKIFYEDLEIIVDKKIEFVLIEDIPKKKLFSKKEEQKKSIESVKIIESSHWFAKDEFYIPYDYNNKKANLRISKDNMIISLNSEPFLHDSGLKLKNADARLSLKTGIYTGKIHTSLEQFNTKAEWRAKCGGLPELIRFLNPAKKSSYLDYWWAVILIIAITFFIFTQSGKRLKKIRRK